MPRTTHSHSSSSILSNNNSDRAHAWCFTLNNPTDEQLPREFDAKYCIWQVEKAPHTNMKHLQGYCVFTNAVRLSHLKRLSREAHWERCHGDHQSNIKYCSKVSSRYYPEREPFTYGTPPEQGKRNDLVQLKSDLDSGMTIKDISSTHFKHFLRYENGIRSYRFLQMPGRTVKTNAMIIYGLTGTGKSYSINHKYPNAFWVARPTDKNSTLWFDGYDGHETVVFDDFYGWCPFDQLLRLCDFTSVQVPVKGGFVIFNPKRIFFTSNHSPYYWYKQSINLELFRSFYRRVEVIIHRNSRQTYAVEKDLVNIIPARQEIGDIIPVDMMEPYHGQNNEISSELPGYISLT